MKSIFISGGINAVYNGFDIYENIIAYPCSNQILIYDIAQVKVINSFSIFKSRVNCVRFLNQSTLVIGDGEGKLVIKNQQNVQETKVSDSIQQIKIIGNFILSITIDGFVYVHNLDLELIDKLQFGHNVMECIDAIEYQQTILVALSGVDTLIHIYELNDKLHFKTSLKGHLRSLNALKFYKNDKLLYLASGAKDAYIRIWNIYQSDINEPKTKQIRLGQAQYTIKLETILQGHMEEVSSLDWLDEKTIASGSFDYNVFIWKQEQDLWVQQTRLGQTHGNKNQIFGIKFNQDKSILAGYTLTGAFYIWKYINQDWVEQPTITGHYAEVTDLDFQEFLITCSMDQTSRLFEKWVENNSYHELARPQIHGYDLNAIKILGQNIISGGDEKVLRSFKPSAFTYNQLNHLSELNLELPDQQYNIVEKNGRQIKEYKVSAESVQQALGLMNIQPVDEDDDGFFYKDVQYNPNFKYDKPPSDALLVAKSLWPEINKFYGHGYAISAIACHGDIAASSSIAITEKAAEIIIWNTKDFKIFQQLQCHNYTVVQLRFSKSGQYLASVSKDRCLGIFKLENNKFTLLSKSEPCKRIVFTVAFSNDESLVYTGSRDQTLRIYETNNAIKPIKEHQFQDIITALDVNEQFIAIGFGEGSIRLYDHQLNFLKEVDPNHKHSKQVNRLLFKDDLLASCSDDHTVRLYKY